MIVERLCILCGSSYKGRPQSRLCSIKCKRNRMYAQRAQSKTHKPRLKELRKEWKSKGLCICCAVPVANTNYSTCERCRNTTKARSAKLKHETFEHYGGIKCNCLGCDITNIMILELDHINGGGNRHRREIGGDRRIYMHLKKLGYPSGFQVLCANCNKGKYLNGGSCPLHAK